jgi:hypothetical protein
MIVPRQSNGLWDLGIYSSQSSNAQSKICFDLLAREVQSPKGDRTECAFPEFGAGGVFPFSSIGGRIMVESRKAENRNREALLGFRWDSSGP